MIHSVADVFKRSSAFHDFGRSRLTFYCFFLSKMISMSSFFHLFVLFCSIVHCLPVAGPQFASRLLNGGKRLFPAVTKGLESAFASSAARNPALVPSAATQELQQIVHSQSHALPPSLSSLTRFEAMKEPVNPPHLNPVLDSHVSLAQKGNFVSVDTPDNIKQLYNLMGSLEKTYSESRIAQELLQDKTFTTKLYEAWSVPHAMSGFLQDKEFAVKYRQLMAAHNMVAGI